MWNGRCCCGICGNAGHHTLHALGPHESLFPPGWLQLCSCSWERHGNVISTLINQLDCFIVRYGNVQPSLKVEQHTEPPGITQLQRVLRLAKPVSLLSTTLRPVILLKRSTLLTPQQHWTEQPLPLPETLASRGFPGTDSLGSPVLVAFLCQRLSVLLSL